MTTRRHERVPPSTKAELLAAVDVASRVLAADVPLAIATSRVARATEHARLCSRLAEQLYAEWYAAVSIPKPLQLSRTLPPMAGMLRAAHAYPAWESGWKAERVSSGGRVVAAKGKERRLLSLDEYVCDERPGLPPRPGATISIALRNDGSQLVPGYWITCSPAWQVEPEDCLRLYWNVGPDGAPALVRHITERLDPDIGYSLKVPLDPRDYGRTDAAVLYIAEDEFVIAAPQIREIRSAVEGVLFNETPKLCKRLAPGLALAESPRQQDESFGTNRCRLVAEALVDAWLCGRTGQAALLGAICRRFRKADVPPDRPYLVSHDRRDYAI